MIFLNLLVAKFIPGMDLDGGQGVVEPLTELEYTRMA